MIRTFSPEPDKAFDRYLDRLERHGGYEETPSGFAYTVADPERMGGDSLIVGKSIVKPDDPDQIEFQLVLGEDMPAEARKLLAEICVDSISADDRYCVARSADKILKASDPSMASLALGHMRVNLGHHRRGIAFGAHERNTRTVEMFRSTLGWTALVTEIGADGQYALSQLEKRGLFIPEFPTGVRLAGNMRTQKGNQPIGITRAVERSERHHCADCSGQILKNTERVTTSLDKPLAQHDHHHYHWTCFIDKSLPKLEVRTATLEPNPYLLNRPNPAQKATRND